MLRVWRVWDFRLRVAGVKKSKHVEQQHVPPLLFGQAFRPISCLAISHIVEL